MLNGPWRTCVERSGRLGFVGTNAVGSRLSARWNLAWTDSFFLADAIGLAGYLSCSPMLNYEAGGGTGTEGCFARLTTKGTDIGAIFP